MRFDESEYRHLYRRTERKRTWRDRVQRWRGNWPLRWPGGELLP